MVWAGSGPKYEVAALLSVVRKFLTPPSTSTNVERLFSYCGQIATKRGSFKFAMLETAVAHFSRHDCK